MQCPECVGALKNPMSGIYQFHCRGCRERLILKERCKESRKELINSLRKWGDNSPTDEAACKCKTFCYQKRVVDGRS